jgi:OOP family OmpA-OmpF porin
MRFLIAGFIAFLGWGLLTVHLYVCKIRGFCNEPESISPVLPAQLVNPGTLSIYFDFDRSDFIPDDMTDRYIVLSNAFLDQNTLSGIIITGHTDAVGTDEYNQSLGYRRAESIQHYFTGKGIPSNRIIIESKGEQDSVDNNITETGRANNRRTVTTIKK